MAKVHSIGSARPLNWTMVNREGNRVSLLKWNYLRARLHARTLLCQNKLAAGEVAARL